MTSEQWWNDVKNDEPRLMDWLRKQYHGELTAWQRIVNYVTTNRENLNTKAVFVLEKIAAQEYTHAHLVSKLLHARGDMALPLPEHSARYWNVTLPEGANALPLEEVSAVAAHAERMR